MRLALAGSAEATALKARIGLTAIRRLAALEQRQTAKRTIGLWPSILGMDEWESQAMAHQDKLCSDTRGDAPVVNADELRDPADVTHRYKPGGNVYATRIRY